MQLCSCLSTSEGYQSLKSSISPRKLRPKLRLLLSHLQTLYLLPQTFGTPFTTTTSTLLLTPLSLLTFDIPVLISIGCFTINTFYLKFLVYTLGPIVCVGGLVLLFFLRKKWYGESEKEESRMVGYLFLLTYVVSLHIDVHDLCIDG